MFFPRLRSHARWVFVLLVIVFGAGFVLLGVGSGTSGLSDILGGNFGDLFGSSTGASAQAKKDRDRIKKNPKDYAAYKDLASALAADGRRRGDRHAPAAEGRQPEGRRRADPARRPLPEQGERGADRGPGDPVLLGEPDQPGRLRARDVDEARQGVPGAQRPDRHRIPGRRERELNTVYGS
jgi:hypothetical protein